MGPYWHVITRSLSVWSTTNSSASANAISLALRWGASCEAGDDTALFYSPSRLRLLEMQRRLLQRSLALDPDL